jgi:hypothetical protein
MKAIELSLPDDVYEKLKELASDDHQSIQRFAIQKLAEMTQAAQDYRELEQRALQGNRSAFAASMAKVPHTPAVPGDEL